MRRSKDFLFVLAVIDCQVSEWTSWSKCNVACGIGTSLRTREIIRPESNGGVQCPPLEEKRTCTASQCSKRRLDKISALRGKIIMKMRNLSRKFDVENEKNACKRVASKICATFLPLPNISRDWVFIGEYLHNT